MLRQLKMYACIARILQPVVCLMSEGLFSCYQWSPNELAFNMMVHGRYDVGKTFIAITTLLKYTTIPGTVREYTNATAAADSTLKHNYDIIIASDETAPFKVNVKAAEMNPVATNKEKVKMTRRQLGLECFEFVKTPDGETHRWTRTVTTDHYFTMVEATNSVVESMNALASRYHRITMAQPRMPASEMEGHMNAELKADTITYLRLNQYLSACAYKAQMCGAMLDCNLQLFYDVSNRVKQYLVERRAISADTGSRGLEIMKPYVRQLIYHMAIHYVFDMPSSPHYKKRFEPSMIRDLQPYLYCTTDIVWWAWTALAPGWIDENCGNVIRAARKAACGGSDAWSADRVTPYEMFERDIDNQIKWRVYKNQQGGAATGDAGGGGGASAVAQDEFVTDLNYLRLPGANMQAICEAIAVYTSPKLDWTDVQGVLNVLSTKYISFDAGTYMIPQPSGTFAYWHKFKALVPSADGKSVGGVKNTLGNGSAVSKTAADVPRIQNKTSHRAVEQGQNCIYFMPVLDDTFTAKQIVAALEYATLTPSMRPGKLLLGIPEDDDATQLLVFPCPRALIDAHVQRYDAAAGWIAHEVTGELEWRGDPELDQDELPVKRVDGIAFNRRGGLSNADSIFFTACPSAPIALGGDEEASWHERSLCDVQSMRDIVEVSADLDLDSARRQHMACGRPLDEPIRSPAWIEQQYRAACQAAGKPWSQDLDYPHDSVLEREKRDAVWRANGPAAMANIVRVSDMNLEDSMTKYNQPRKPETQRLLAAREARKRSREHLATSSSSGGSSLFSLDEENTRMGASIDLTTELRRRPAAAVATAAAPAAQKKQKAAAAPVATSSRVQNLIRR